MWFDTLIRVSFFEESSAKRQEEDLRPVTSIKWIEVVDLQLGSKGFICLQNSPGFLMFVEAFWQNAFISLRLRDVTLFTIRLSGVWHRVFLVLFKKAIPWRHFTRYFRSYPSYLFLLQRGMQVEYIVIKFPPVFPDIIGVFIEIGGIPRNVL